MADTKTKTDTETTTNGAVAGSDDSTESFVDAAEDLQGQIDEVTAAVEEIVIETDFSIVTLDECFTKCLTHPNLDHESYVRGYRELYKFLTMLGTVFTWVASDVKNKIELLQKYLAAEQNEKYATVQDMIEYEVDQGLIKRKKNDDPSGSRTLLRLHRALEYIIAFLSSVQSISDDDKCSVVSRKAYETTLMKYHPWVVQKAAKLGMALLPTKKGLVDKLVPSGDPELIKKAHEDLPKAVETMQKVYDITQEFYKEKDLLNIP